MKNNRLLLLIIPILFLIILAAVLEPSFLYPGVRSQQEDPAILKDKVEDLAGQVEVRDKELELRRATIAKQRFMLVSLVLFAALAAAAVGFFRFREMNRRKELKNELIRTQQQALSRQMNPHFIFNTLGSLQSFILKNDRDASNLYLTKFSQLMRFILDLRNSQGEASGTRVEIFIKSGGS